MLDTTHRDSRLFLLLAIAFPLLLPGAAPAGAQEGGFEEPPTLRASDVVAAELLEGPYHRVADEVRNDGFMNHFTIRSDFGDFEAESEWMLRVRIREVGAIAELREISRSEAFADALQDAALAPVRAVGQVVTQPVSTVKGMPGAVGRKFRGLYYRSRKQVHKLDDQMSRQEGEKQGDRDEATAESEATPSAAEGEGSDVSQTVQKEAQDYLGYTSARRDLARRLGVDPYSSNPVLQAELERLSQAAFAAGLSFKALDPGVSALQAIEETNEMIWELPPAELERRNNLALKEMGIDKATRLDFFANRWYSPSLQTLLVDALAELESATKREAALQLVLQAESAAEARLFTQSIRLLAQYDGSVGPIAELIVAGNEELGEILAAVDGNGVLVVPAAFDYLIWQPGMEGRGPLYRYEERTLRLTGRPSPRARRELESRGWTVDERVLEGAGL